MAKVKMITISQKRYDELLEAEKLLATLKEFGVDNWDGYGDALDHCFGGETNEWL